jgi:hypothetical protein
MNNAKPAQNCISERFIFVVLFHVVSNRRGGIRVSGPELSRVEWGFV